MTARHGTDGNKQAIDPREDYVDVGERFERLKRTLMVLGGLGALISLSAEPSVKLGYSGQNLLLPAWIVTASIAVSIIYYLKLFNRQATLVRHRHGVYGLMTNASNVHSHVNSIRAEVIKKFDAIKSLSSDRISSEISKLVRMVGKSESIETFIFVPTSFYGQLKDAESLSELDASYVERHLKELEEKANLSLKALASSNDKDARAMIERLETVIEQALKQHNNIAERMDKAVEQSRLLEGELKTLSDAFSKTAKVHFTWWEVRAPNALAIVACILCIFTTVTALLYPSGMPRRWLQPTIQEVEASATPDLVEDASLSPSSLRGRTGVHSANAIIIRG
jgi:hypothetical protein